MTGNILVLIFFILAMILLVAAVILIIVFYAVRYVSLKKIKKEETNKKENIDNT